MAHIALLSAIAESVRAQPTCFAFDLYRWRACFQCKCVQGTKIVNSRCYFKQYRAELPQILAKSSKSANYILSIFIKARKSYSSIYIHKRAELSVNLSIKRFGKILYIQDAPMNKSIPIFINSKIQYFVTICEKSLFGISN